MSSAIAPPTFTLPNGTGNGNSHTHITTANGPLRDLLSQPLTFGPPVTKSSQDLENCTKTVIAGPPSPGPFRQISINGEGSMTHSPRKVMASTTVNSSQPSLETTTSTSPAPSIRTPAQSQSQSHAIDPTIYSPSRKGKEPASASLETPKKQSIVKRQDVDVSWPEQLAMIKRPAAGLHNPSMACYANATLQVLLHTPPVLHAAQNHNHKNCIQADTKGFCMLCALKELALGNHWTGRDKAYMARPVLDKLAYIKKGFSKGRQEDTHEFFRFVTDGLVASALAGQPKDVSEKTKHSTWVHKTWGGRVRSRVICERCRKPSDTFDHFLDLSVDVNKAGQKTLLAMLQGFVKEDRLEGANKYHCESCKAKSVATKSFKIFEAPPILTIHFKRFEMSFGYGGRARADKFNGYIQYPEWLDIAPYMVNKDQGHYYRLFGVTCHRGNELRFGHYTSYVRHPSGQWYDADDEDMTRVPATQALGDKNAYLISYIRVSEQEYKTRTPASTPSRPLTALNGNGNTPVTYGKSNGSPSKRKRDSDDEGTPNGNGNGHGHGVKNARYGEGTPNGMIGPRLPPSPPPDSPPPPPPTYDLQPGESRYTPFTNSDHGHPKFKPKPAGEMYQPRPLLSDEQVLSPIDRPGNPRGRDWDGMSKRERKKARQTQTQNRADRDEFGQGHKRNYRSGGAPMPYMHGRGGNNGGRGGGRGGMIGRMRGKPPGR